MLFSRNTSAALEELIIESLGSRALSGAALLMYVRKTLPKASKETFYRVLRSLLKTEVVTKYGVLYGLNRHWVQRLYRFSKPKIEMTKSADRYGIGSFEDGDSITYTFKTPNLMGIYWAHLYDAVFDMHDPDIPILIFHPHEWLIHTRTQSETFFLSRFFEDKKRGLFSIGGTTDLDKHFKKEWANEYLRINTGMTHSLKQTEYINVLGEYVFKIVVSVQFSRDIDTFFKKYKTITEENQQELSDLCNRKDKVKMVFTRSSKEAQKWYTKWKKEYVMHAH